MTPTAPQEVPFADEFPHLTAIGRAGLRYLISLAVSVVVIFVCAGLGLREFLAGWFSGCALMIAMHELKAAGPLRTREGQTP